MTQSNVNLSQDSDDTQANLAQEVETQFSTQNIEQALDILSFEAENLNDAQQQETAIANVNLLRNLMRQTGVVAPMMANPGGAVGAGGPVGPIGAFSLGEASNKAMDVASRVQNLGFVEFTAGLINGTFDAIIGATIKQMQAYASLVADVAKTLAEFQAENVSDAQINAYLSNRYPDGAGGTSIRATTTTPAVTGHAFSSQGDMLAVANALVLETAGLETGKLTYLLLGFAGTPLVHGTPSSLTFKDTEVVLIRKAIGMMLASSMMSHLRAMAREGMARIVITDGSIRTKLTFTVSSTEEQKTQQATFQRDSFNVGVRGRAGWGWGSASVGADYARLNVNTVNESSTASITMTTEMIGEVNIKFRTETFAPYEAPPLKAA
jgi:hypothetical protein